MEAKQVIQDESEPRTVKSTKKMYTRRRKKALSNANGDM